MENIKQRIIEAFTATPTARIQGRGRKPLQISKGNKFLGIKTNRKFLGRNRSGRNKVKSKRRNNFKTFEARKILSQRHGVTIALKKQDNKYLLSYGDIARLMRQNNYTYNQTLRRWMTKKEKDDEKDVKKNAYPNKQKQATAPTHKSDKEVKKPDDVEKADDDVTPKSEPFKFEPVDKKKPKDKDRLKIMQARIVLIANGQTDVGNYEIIPDDIEFVVPDKEVKQKMLDSGFLWLKNRDKWVDYKGKDPNPLEKYKGTLGRAILVSNGDYSFLDFKDGNISMVSDKMEELGYEYLDGTWVSKDEKEPLEEAAGTSSTPANAGTGSNSQGISPFMSRLGSKVSKRKKPERIVI